MIKLGDCLEGLRALPDNSVDSIVTDPPYGLKFMGKAWDYDVPPEEVWRECLRVLKPGGHLLCFAGTRTQHRMAVRIEDAGFEIRDMIAWVYGSGFPKSLDVSKAIDKAAGAEREVVGSKTVSRDFTAGEGEDIAFRSGRPGQTEVPVTAAATPEAQRWEGWGTALKPALETVTVARKPLGEKTVAANVLAHGTGALNIDGCRVGDFQNTTPSGVDRRNAKLAELGYRPGEYQMGEKVPNTPPGRWPANLIHDGSEEVVAGFPIVKGGTAVRRNSGGNTFGGCRPKPTMGDMGYGDAGSAARFFYCAKASKKDRGDGNNHPTVKPTDLMRYLCRLVTPPGGLVLDPYTGSGSTAKAAALEGFRFIGFEIDPDYHAIAERRWLAAIGELA